MMYANGHGFKRLNGITNSVTKVAATVCPKNGWK